jgi:Bacterial regulatory helix-turn-helix protein, lysR family
MRPKSTRASDDIPLSVDAGAELPANTSDDQGITSKPGAVELRHPHYFIAAAEHGSFRKAGNAIGVQQSSLGRRIRDPEYQLGTSLFYRSRRTPISEMFARSDQCR